MRMLKALLERPGFLVALGVVLITGVVLIATGPAMDDEVGVLVGPGQFILSLGAGLSLAYASRLLEVSWAKRTTTVVAVVAFAFAALALLAILNTGF